MPHYDRYAIPGTDGVLRNKFGFTRQSDVNTAMNRAATTEWAILQLEPIPDQLDIAYLQEIHRRFFSPVIEWAGQMRAFGDEVGAGGTNFRYADSRFYAQELERVFVELAEEDYLAGLDADEFVRKLADRWGTITFCHPFRDGNTRSQSAWVDRLATRAGHPIDWRRVNVPELREARLSAAFRVDGERVLAAYLKEHLATDRTPASLCFGIAQPEKDW